LVGNDRYAAEVKKVLNVSFVEGEKEGEKSTVGLEKLIGDNRMIFVSRGQSAQ
jgi:hypothetical protein